MQSLKVTDEQMQSPPTKSEQYYRRACKSLATGVSSSMRRSVTPIPLYIDKADGPYFYDVDGRELVDYTLGWGPLIVGSNHAAVNRAICRQLERGYTYGAQHLVEIELAEQIVASVPGVEQVIFGNTGTEAVQAALRIARAKTDRQKIVKFEGHYHGWMNNILVSYHPKNGSPYIAMPACGGQPVSEYADTIVLPWNDLEALEQLLSEQGREIACVITEPILANSGCCMPRDGFLSGLVETCREHGVVSIFDEVITGFRVALGGARELFGIEPDLSVYGKALAGGFTLSAVGGRAEMFDVLRDGRTIHAGTYNGTPINLLAAVETLKALKSGNVFEEMNKNGQMLQEEIRRFALKAGVNLAISGVGSVFSTHFGVTEAPTNYRETLQTDTQQYELFRAAMLRHWVYLLPDARWYVGAAHNEESLEKTSHALENAFTEITR